MGVGFVTCVPLGAVGLYTIRKTLLEGRLAGLAFVRFRVFLPPAIFPLFCPAGACGLMPIAAAFPFLRRSPARSGHT